MPSDARARRGTSVRGATVPRQEHNASVFLEHEVQCRDSQAVEAAEKGGNEGMSL